METTGATGFAGFPRWRAGDGQNPDVAVVEVPMGVTYPGRTPHSAAAPAAIRRQAVGLSRFLTHHDFTFGRPLLSLRETTVVDAGDVPVVTPAEQHARTTAMIDAHIDYRDEVEGEREGLSSGMRRSMELPWVESIVQVGVRGGGSAIVNDVQDALVAGCLPIGALEMHLHGMEAALTRDEF